MFFSKNKNEKQIKSEFQPEPEQDEQIKKLKDENARLKGIQSAMPDPYYVRDMDYNVVYWSDAIAKLTGYTEEETKKLKCYQMFKAVVCPPANECPTQGCIKSKQFLRDVAVDVYHKSGTTIHTLVSNAGVYDDDGNPIGAVEIVKDNTKIQSSMDSISLIIKTIEASSASLFSVIEKVRTSSAAVHEKALESLDSVETGVKAGNSVYEKTENSSKQTESIQGSMQTINDSMKISVDKISTLKEKSEAIIEFVKVIQDIAAKTNLLAINASIEAAHAGESGRGFSVVADGIRELSKNSSESAESIQQTIQEIIRLIKDAINSLIVTEKDIESGTNSISELFSHINEIDNAAKVLSNTLETIESASTTTTQLSREQDTSVTQAENLGRNLTDIAKSLANEFDKVIKAIQHTDMG